MFFGACIGEFVVSLDFEIWILDFIDFWNLNFGFFASNQGISRNCCKFASG